MSRCNQKHAGEFSQGYSLHSHQEVKQNRMCCTNRTEKHYHEWMHEKKTTHSQQSTIGINKQCSTLDSVKRRHKGLGIKLEKCVLTHELAERHNALCVVAIRVTYMAQSPVCFC